MILSSLSIDRVSYGDREGQYNGRIGFKDQYGAVEVQCGHELSAQVVALCAEAIKAQVNRTAEAINNSVAGLISQPSVPLIGTDSET